MSWGNPFLTNENSKGPDHPECPHSLISAFAVCFLDSRMYVLNPNFQDASYPLRLSSWFESYLVQTSLDRFSRELAKLFPNLPLQTKDHTKSILHAFKVVRWAEWGFFHDHNSTLKSIFIILVHPVLICNPTKFHQLIFEGKNGLKIKYWIKAM